MKHYASEREASTHAVKHDLEVCVRPGQVAPGGARQPGRTREARFCRFRVFCFRAGCIGRQQHGVNGFGESRREVVPVTVPGRDGFVT